MGARYSGPACFVPFDQTLTVPRRFRKPRLVLLRGGWHYSTRQTPAGEVPDRPLHLNIDDPAAPFYEYADPGHLSHLEKHGPGRPLVLEGLPPSVEHP